MKKIIFFGSAVILFSCQKNSEQIDVAIRDLQRWNKTEKEINEYKFDVTEMMDKDMYDILYKIHTESSHRSRDVGAYEEAQKELNLASKFIDSTGKAKGEKTFYKVHFYRLLDKDTVGNGYLMLNDKNKKIGFKYLK